MKKYLVGAALMATTIGAQAADLAVKAPVFKAPALAIYNWTGFYIGVNGGGSVGRDRTSLLINGGAISAEQSNLSPYGAIGGGQLGYNWQFGNWVLGVEGDIQGSGQRDRTTCLITCSPPNAFAQFDQRLDWFATARGRVGYATGPVLSYVTAGYAYGDVKTSIASPLGPFSNDTGRSGYAIGSGVEASLGGNWTGKVEYLYLDLGTINATQTAAIVGAAPVTGVLSTRVRDQIFRAGVNYRINGNGAYAPTPVANWTGFYIGGNGGSSLGRDRSSLALPGGTETFTLVPDGYNAGGQIGYNWQASAWVFGLEADFQGAIARDKDACIALCIVGSSATLRQSLPYYGTARGRIGYSVGSTLFYGTAGYAYGATKTTITEVNGALTGAQTINQSRGGWTAGGGIESPLQLFGLFGPNWTAKTEYLYVDLGRTTNTFTLVGAAQTFSTRTQEHIFRGGLNYHFNSPLVARY